ncbi:secreted antigen 1 [Babesia caballi]|uniref:Secreted antigen 1 n=1 Tax=Babesia caballi TaxID=5871 RepID=A0AAV4LLK4_BABCB|nr:secreted antigen 1 [Babesia caballi]
MTADSNAVITPKTLKDALDFLSKLHTLNLGDTVGKALQNKVEANIKTLSAIDGIITLSFTEELTDNVKEVLQGVASLRSVIVNNGDSYGSYQSFAIDGCTDECTTILLEILPNLYNTLFYLYFQVTPSFKRRGSGEWETQTCKNDPANDDYLHEWLIGKQGIPSSRTSSAAVLPGGYGEGELSTKSGDDLHNILFGFVDGEGEETSFSKLIVTIISASDLTEASTAATVIWVVAFCKAVVEGVFSEKSEHRINTCISIACSNVLTNIRRIAPEGSTGSNLIALCEGTVDYCTRNTQSDDFDVYVEWLKKHLLTVIGNLQQMGSACQNWDNLSFDQGTHAGPFAYGFMFGKGWENGAINGRNRLSNTIEKLTEQSELRGSLWTLLKCINPEAEIIVDNKQPQQEAPAAEAVGAAANHAATSGHVSGSVAVSGMVSETHGDASVASAAGEVQTGRQNAQSSGGSTGATISSDGAQSTSTSEGQRNDEIQSNAQETRGTTEAADPQSASGSGSLNESASHPTDTNTGAVQHQQSAAITQTGSSGGTNKSTNGDSITNDKGSDTSTITIGSAAGGVALLGGGGAALYFLNVGGIKTLITGVP